jgi:hypothetical protein
VKLALDIVCAANAGCARAEGIVRTTHFDDGCRMCAIDMAIKALAGVGNASIVRRKGQMLPLGYFADRHSVGAQYLVCDGRACSH